MTSYPQINAQRLLRRIADFATIGATPAGGVNRQALSIGDRTARRQLAELAVARGFKANQDAIANLFIRREGHDPSLPPVLIGSHLDSQPTGGRFDGALGTLSAFEVLEALEDAGAVTERSVEVVSWTNEEGSRFSPGCMGSMAFIGAGDMAVWQDARGTDGVRLGDELEATLKALPEAKMQPVGHVVSAFVEMHIEQGPVLERAGIPIGLVTGVQGTRWLEVSFSGEAAHAGTTPLEFRKDPMAAAVAAIAQLQLLVMPADPMARLTVGRMSVEPSSVNVIPSRVTFTIDIRHPREDVLSSIEAQIDAECRASAMRHMVDVLIKKRFDLAPGQFDTAIVDVIDKACERLGVSNMKLVSGAFHDALFISRVAPTAMIFVPCRDGISHNEAEFVTSENIETGAKVLLETALSLAR
ncbi:MULTISPECIES: Zn-dependent hydrolase [Rhizobium]|uniref:Zn-dependent hydrolase n=1 Tax=Rhizobium TaxID=379 RepID=UPI00119AFD64|nr:MULTISPECIES: Zn-dependent hydrolase [Rhizobium]MCZ3374708.1 Zn-dependent hydrolase [Rhizobium sp. AG207R]TWB10867.1 N-carbamoyl-L-amino-acid hydrolase [Rhizobium sp. ERR1071]